MRILISTENKHRAYGDAIAYAIAGMRPHTEVSVGELEDLEEDLRDRKADVVFCGRSEPAEPKEAPGWVELSAEPGVPTKVRAGGYRWEMRNPSLRALLSIVDTVEKTLLASPGSMPVAV